MNVLLNGAAREIGEDLTLRDLIESLGLHKTTVVVELNGAIMPKESYPLAALREGDRVEIVHFVGGG